MAVTDTTTNAQALLALYGALDRAVTSNRGAGVEATVERYLPGSTGANAGWYDELLGFLSDYAGIGPGKEPPAAPDLSQALTVLASRSKPRTQDAAAGLTPVQLSRMVYAIGALSHLPSSFLPRDWDQKVVRTLTRAGAGADLLALLRSEFGDRADWPQVMLSAQQNGLIDPDVALVPPCQAKAIWLHGHLCVVLTTEFESAKVSLNQLKDVIDPLNWHNCLPFFCKMEGYKARPDGWSRVLEHVSTTCSIQGTPQMVTPLKYWNGPGEDLQPPTAWVDYALDDDPLPDEKGDGRMVVDEGFIRMTSTVDSAAKAGVRVRTRKVAGFRDLAYVPAAILACVMGYGDQGMEMLLDGVAKRAADKGKGWKDWEPSAPTGGPAQFAAKAGQPGDGGDITGRAVALAVDMLNECIDDMSKKSAAIAAEWAAGATPIAETMTFATDLAARLSTDPWRYLERLRGPAPGSDT